MSMNAKILLVEDNAANRYLATFLLEKAGYIVRHASNGEEAIRSAQSERPDLVLMDLQMPGMDGFEAAQRIRLIPKSGDVVMVALSSHTTEANRQKAIASGFNGYLEKPIVTGTFTNEIANFLSGKAGAP